MFEKETEAKVDELVEYYEIEFGIIVDRSKVIETMINIGLDATKHEHKHMTREEKRQEAKDFE